MNKENLLKLADYLEKNVTQEIFDMQSYRSNGSFYCDFKDKNDCGSIGCAIGWGPFTEGLEIIESDYRSDKSVNFSTYCERVFGIMDGGERWIHLLEQLRG